ncbi:hypothetical protein [Chitinimonas koreensis]|uniref:hypothetical protein n=1 Tax=Chitinimonas koreensis TaxID=356302 RepID=UPI0016543786|nr:hypothetical protein [Chitinimonas koreensis]QNM95282.1 hypothetical protein H9L41_15540 [Chitinimonas koreensis]
MYGGQLLPLFLENLPGFPTMEAGLYLMPRGIATFVSMSLVGRFSGRFSARSMICAGMLLSLAGTYEMIRLTPQAPGSVILLPMILLGLGLGLICIPLSSLAFATIPAGWRPRWPGCTAWCARSAPRSASRWPRPVSTTRPR